jgi:hypothetical protein
MNKPAAATGVPKPVTVYGDLTKYRQFRFELQPTRIEK